MIKSVCLEHRVTIIEDATQSILTTPCTIGDYCIASFRKWMAIPDGGVIYSRNPLPKEWGKLKCAQTYHKIVVMMLKNLFLGHAVFYKDFERTERVNNFYRNMFIKEELVDRRHEKYGILHLTAFLLKSQGVDEIMHISKRNYELL